MTIEENDSFWDYRPQYFPGVHDKELKPYNQCIGVTRRRRRCINKSSAGKCVPHKLEHLLATENPTQNELQSIAGALLCEHSHQYQAAGIAQRWLEEVLQSRSALPSMPPKGTVTPVECSRCVTSDGKSDPSDIWDTPISGRNGSPNITPGTSPSLAREDSPTIKNEEGELLHPANINTTC